MDHFRYPRGAAGEEGPGHGHPARYAGMLNFILQARRFALFFFFKLMKLHFR